MLLLKLLPNVCVPTLVISQVGELLPEVNYYTGYSRRIWGPELAAESFPGGQIPAYIILPAAWRTVRILVHL